MEILAIFAAIAVIGTMSFGGGSVGQAFAMCIDLPSLISILILTVPVLLRKGIWKDLCRAFHFVRRNYKCSLADMKRSLEALEFTQKQILCAGVITSIFGIIGVCSNMTDLSKIGPSLAIVVLPLLYTAFLELLLLPMHVEIKGRIINYMEE
jgi:flagellar motor component MotA